MRRFLIALQFLTRFPLKLEPAPSPEDIGPSMTYFPLAGLCLGLYLVVLNCLLTYFLPPVLVDALLVLGLVMATGAMHLDGLADTADGFYTGNDKERIFAVMKDSRLGVMGGLAIFFVMLLKILALHSLAPGMKNSLLLLTPMLSRWYLVWAAALCGYANPGAGGLGETFTRSINQEQLIKTSPLPCLLTLLFLGTNGLFMLILSIIITYSLIIYIKRKIGGMNGDTFGALNETMEAVTLILALALGW